MNWFVDKFIKRRLKRNLARAKNEVETVARAIPEEHHKAVPFIVAILTLLLGVLSSSPLLEYTGRQPVNVFFFIFIFLLIPLISNLILILLVLFKIINLKKIWIVSDNLKIISLAMVFFTVGGLATLFAKVVFTDMVFGWSTTSGLTAEHVYFFTSVISAPWAFLSNDFVPSLQFIEQSQFIKMGESFKTIGGESIENLKNLGNWWKFLSMSVIFYGVLPRFIVFGLLHTLQAFKLKKKATANTKIDKTYVLKFDQSNLGSYFSLEGEEISIYYSLLEGIALSDIENEKDFLQKGLKQEWLNKWKQIAFETYPSNFDFLSHEHLVEALKNSPRPKLFKVVADSSLFVPYYALNEAKSEIKNFKGNYSRDYLNAIVTKSGSNPENINEYFDEYQRLYNRDKYIKWGTIATLSLVGAAALAFTGGAVAPIIGAHIGGLAGLTGAAAVSHGLAILGVGALVSNVGGTALVIGGGGLLGTISGGFVASQLYNDNDQAYRSDLCKLVALIRCEFFNHDHFQKNISVYRDYVLGHIKAQDFDKTKKNKAIEKISKAFLDKEFSQ